MSGNALHIRCSQCLAEAENPLWADTYADTIYRGFALCLRHFTAMRGKDVTRGASDG